MRISDWSSDVCSSDLDAVVARPLDRHVSYLPVGARAGRQCPQRPRCSATSCALRLATCRPSNAPITSVHGIIRADNRTIVRAANTSPTAANFLLDSRGEATVDQPSVDNPVSRTDEHTSELQSLMRLSYAVFGLKKKT